MPNHSATSGEDPNRTRIMLHATYLAEALVGWLGGPTSERDALTAYRRGRDDGAVAAARRTVAVSRDLHQLG
jgi:hypothetical protein